MRPVLGLPVERYGPHDPEGVSPAIARIREYGARLAEANQPPRVTLGDVARQAVTELKDALKPAKAPRVTKTDKAKAWLATVLQDGPLPQTEVEALAKKEGIGTKPLKLAKGKLRVESVRKGRNHWAWRLPMAL